MRVDFNAAIFSGIVTKIIPKERSVHVIVRQTRFIKELEGGGREFEYNWLRCVARGATADYIKKDGIQERDPVEVYAKIRQDEWVDEKDPEKKKQRSIKFMIERIIRTAKRENEKKEETEVKEDAETIEEKE